MTAEEESTSGTAVTPASAVPAVAANRIIHPSVFTILILRANDYLSVLYTPAGVRAAQKVPNLVLFGTFRLVFGPLRTIDHDARHRPLDGLKLESKLR